MPDAPLVGSIEAGGTKFVCTVGTGPDDIRDEMVKAAAAAGWTKAI